MQFTIHLLIHVVSPPFLSPQQAVIQIHSVAYTSALVLEMKGHLWRTYFQVRVNNRHALRTHPVHIKQMLREFQTRIEVVCHRDTNLLKTLKCTDWTSGSHHQLLSLNVVFFLSIPCYCRNLLRLPFAHYSNIVALHSWNRLK